MMMTIDLRSSRVEISDALRDHIERRVDFAVRRFAARIRRIVVRLVDLNGPRGGPDKRCRIIAFLEEEGSVIVEATDADAYAAASQAAGRLDERVRRALAKRRWPARAPGINASGGHRRARAPARPDRSRARR